MIIGSIDTLEGRIAGWVADTDRPHDPLMIDIYVDGVLAASVLANGQRPDLESLGFGTTHFAFECPWPAIVRFADPVIFGMTKGAFIVPSRAARKQPRGFARYRNPQVLNILPAQQVGYRVGAETTDFDLAFARRLAKSISKHADDISASEAGPLWGHWVSKHADVVKLAHRSPAQFCEYMAEVGRHDLASGFLDGPEAFLAADRGDELFLADMQQVTFDRLISLAHYIGCIKPENPEQGPWGYCNSFSPDEILQGIADSLQIDLTPPPIGGYWGLKTKFGIFNSRIIECLYAAVILKKCMQIHGAVDVVEIGGGSGATAYYARRMGVENYTIVDLPTVSLVQAYAHRFDKHLTIFSEDQIGQGVRLITPPMFEHVISTKPTILLNQDSLPEIEKSAASLYLIQAKALGIGIFLSLNQESGGQVQEWHQNQVSELAAAAGGYSLLSRNMDWLRPGYVDEIYRIA